MMDTKDAASLSTWIDYTMSSQVKELAGFAKGMISDLEAVQNALTMAWSYGQVEGQVNRLKTIKRQMYGHASLMMLRKRLIYQSSYT